MNFCANFLRLTAGALVGLVLAGTGAAQAAVKRAAANIAFILSTLVPAYGFSAIFFMLASALLNTPVRRSRAADLSAAVASEVWS